MTDLIGGLILSIWFGIIVGFFAICVLMALETRRQTRGRK
jgi:uncharacterized protein (DUF2062 family)